MLRDNKKSKIRVPKASNPNNYQKIIVVLLFLSFLLIWVMLPFNSNSGNKRYYKTLNCDLSNLIQNT
ncbi:MAG: hypothetical protein ACXAEU_25380, partial [Candidatus Hodarchaeales archaeon]